MVLALLIGGLFLPGQSLGYQLIFLAFSVISAGQLALNALLKARDDVFDPLALPVLVFVGLVMAIGTAYAVEMSLPGVPTMAVMLAEGLLYGGAMGLLVGDKVEDVRATFQEVVARLTEGERWWVDGGAAYAVEQMGLNWNWRDLDDPRRPTLLHHAAEMGLPDLAEALVARGARPGKRDANGELPLHYAARNGHERVVSLLMDEGGLIRAGDKTRALHLAEAHGHADTARTLVAHDARAVVQRERVSLGI
jgi:hypothetical protein